MGENETDNIVADLNSKFSCINKTLPYQRQLILSGKVYQYSEKILNIESERVIFEE